MLCFVLVDANPRCGVACHLDRQATARELPAKAGLEKRCDFLALPGAAVNLHLSAPRVLEDRGEVNIGRRIVAR